MTNVKTNIRAEPKEFLRKQIRFKCHSISGFDHQFTREKQDYLHEKKGWYGLSVYDYSRFEYSAILNWVKARVPEVWKSNQRFCYDHFRLVGRIDNLPEMSLWCESQALATEFEQFVEGFSRPHLWVLKSATISAAAKKLLRGKNWHLLNGSLGVCFSIEDLPEEELVAIRLALN